MFDKHKNKISKKSDDSDIKCIEKCIEECSYNENGQLHGIFILNYPNGQLRKKLEYYNGVIVDGEYVEFYPNGKVKKEFIIKNNIIQEFKYFIYIFGSIGIYIHYLLQEDEIKNIITRFGNRKCTNITEKVKYYDEKFQLYNFTTKQNLLDIHINKYLSYFYTYQTKYDIQHCHMWLNYDDTFGIRYTFNNNVIFKFLDYINCDINCPNIVLNIKNDLLDGILKFDYNDIYFKIEFSNGEIISDINKTYYKIEDNKLKSTTIQNNEIFKSEKYYSYFKICGKYHNLNKSSRKIYNNNLNNLNIFNYSYESFYENGNLKEKCNYDNNIKNGSYESFYENSNPKEKYNLLNNVKHGSYDSFYENGNPKEKINYVNGLKNGSYESFYENGKLKTTCNYVNDKIVGKSITYPNN
jgi:antitoxin component YwqK of YwqJK toxin-antitoxin module